MQKSMTEFEAECSARVGQLRTAFIELYDSIGADPQKPQEVARTLRVNKTLAWNVARLLAASDALAAVSHVPGKASLEKVIQASQKHGAGAEFVARARTAVQDFSRMIESHAGDRPTLDLIIDGAGRGNGDQLELSRKLAFRGNSGLYGVQARTRFKCAMLAPHPDQPTVLDMVDVNGYVDFRRLRPSVSWPIFIVRAWSERSEPILGPSWEPIEPPTEESDHSQIIHSFTRGSLPQIKPVETPEGTDYVLGAGPVGNEGAFDCFWGQFMRKAASRYGERQGEIGEFGATITAPAEQLVFDLIVHRDLEFALKPDVLVFGRIFPQGRPTGEADDPTLIPIRQSTVELPGSPPIVNTPLVPRYPQLLKKIYERMDWNPEDFRGVRLTMKYPPLGANVILRFPLEPKPGEATLLK